MQNGVFQAQLNDIEKLLIQLNLFKDRNPRPPYTYYTASFFRHKSYKEIWKNCIENQIYDFLLIDDSLIQFRINSINPLSLSYSYLNSPFITPISFDDFFKDQESYIAEGKDEYEIIRDYDYYLQSLTPKEHVIPIRYDYDLKAYFPGRHPAAHVHVGHDNNLRIATKKILRPLSFMLFILRQFFPDAWIEFLSSKDANIICRNVREHPDDIHEDYWKDLDEFEMRLY